MDRNQAKEMLPIIQAYAEGKSIESSSITDVSKAWREVTDFPLGMIDSFKFRIKPESKYRPFNNAEECWAEMQKYQPFGWVKLKDTESGYYMLKGIASQVVIGFNETPFSYKKVFEDYTFADGTPFGVKIEEDYNGIK